MPGGTDNKLGLIFEVENESAIAGVDGINKAINSYGSNLDNLSKKEAANTQITKQATAVETQQTNALNISSKAATQNAVSQEKVGEATKGVTRGLGSASAQLSEVTDKLSGGNEAAKKLTQGLTQSVSTLLMLGPAAAGAQLAMQAIMYGVNELSKAIENVHWEAFISSLQISPGAFSLDDINLGLDGIKTKAKELSGNIAEDMAILGRDGTAEIEKLIRQGMDPLEAKLQVVHEAQAQWTGKIGPVAAKYRDLEKNLTSLKGLNQEMYNLENNRFNMLQRGYDQQIKDLNQIVNLQEREAAAYSMMRKVQNDVKMTEADRAQYTEQTAQVAEEAANKRRQEAEAANAAWRAAQQKADQERIGNLQFELSLGASKTQQLDAWNKLLQEGLNTEEARTSVKRNVATLEFQIAQEREKAETVLADKIQQLTLSEYDYKIEKLNEWYEAQKMILGESEQLNQAYSLQQQQITDDWFKSIDKQMADAQKKMEEQVKAAASEIMTPMKGALDAMSAAWKATNEWGLQMNAQYGENARNLAEIKKKAVVAAMWAQVQEEMKAMAWRLGFEAAEAALMGQWGKAAGLTALALAAGGGAMLAGATSNAATQEAEAMKRQEEARLQAKQAAEIEVPTTGGGGGGTPEKRGGGAGTTVKSANVVNITNYISTSIYGAVGIERFTEMVEGIVIKAQRAGRLG